MATADEYGIIPAIVLWQTNHPDVMLPPHIFGTDPASDQLVTLLTVGQANKKDLSNVLKRVLPLMVAVGLGREPDYLAKVIGHHQITYQDIKDCYWDSDFSVVVAGTENSFNDTDLSIAFFRAVNVCPELKGHAEPEVYEDKTEVGLIFIDDAAFSIKDRYLQSEFDSEKDKLLKLSMQIATKTDFSKEIYWPDGNVGKLIERAGGYLDDVLYGDQLHRAQPDENPDFWYALIKDTARELEEDDRVCYLRKILSSVDKSEDTLFYKGLRIIEAYADVEDDIFDELRDIESALGDNGRRVITDLQLLKGSVNPADTRTSLFKAGYAGRFDDKQFVHNILTELLSIDQREVGHADLVAFSKLHFMNGKEQDLSNVDVPRALKLILAVYGSKCDNFKASANISDGMAKTISFLKDKLPLDLKWTEGLGDEALTLLAMGGVRTHEKLSLKGRAQVFGYDLNL
jgi:hypothetical protein